MTPNKSGLILHGCCWSVVRTSVPRTNLKKPRCTKVDAHPIERSIFRETLLLNHFLVQGIDVNAKNKYGNAPLHLTCLYGKLEVARMLLEHGTTANMESENGETPLHQVSQGKYASERTGVDVARLLLKHGVYVDARKNRGSTALHGAAFNGRLEIVRLHV